MLDMLEHMYICVYLRFDKTLEQSKSSLSLYLWEIYNNHIQNPFLWDWESI